MFGNLVLLKFVPCNNVSPNMEIILDGKECVVTDVIAIPSNDDITLKFENHSDLTISIDTPIELLIRLAILKVSPDIDADLVFLDKINAGGGIVLNKDSSYSLARRVDSVPHLAKKAFDTYQKVKEYSKYACLIIHKDLSA